MDYKSTLGPCMLYKSSHSALDRRDRPYDAILIGRFKCDSLTWLLRAVSSDC